MSRAYKRRKKNPAVIHRAEKLNIGAKAKKGAMQVFRQNIDRRIAQISLGGN